MKEVRVNEVFFSERDEQVAVIVTDGIKFKTIRMKCTDFEKMAISVVPVLHVKKDSLGNIIAMLPEQWISVTQDRPTVYEEPPYDYRHEYL